MPGAPGSVLAADSGFSFGDPYALGLLFAGASLFAAVLALSQQRNRAFSAAVVYLFLGAALAGGLHLLGVSLIDPFEDPALIERLAEFGVTVALFSAGLKLDRPLSARHWRSVILLLAVVMPLTIAAVAALGVALAGLSLGAAIALGGALAPTDPVLASGVTVGGPGEQDEPETRFALTGEAGFNDGLAFPFVFLGLLIAAQDGTGWVAEWVAADVLYAVAAGLAIGVGAGRGLAALVAALHDRGILAPRLDGWLAIATVLAVYGLTELAGGYGFLAAFASGLAFRRHEHHHEFHGRVHAGSETVEKFMELALVLTLGSTVTIAGLAAPGLGGYVLIAALLLLVRPAVTLLAFVRSELDLRERAFIGWFGIRGVGTLYYVAVILGSGVLSPSEAETVYWIAIACAGISIVLHGLTATPLARRLDASGP